MSDIQEMQRRFAEERSPTPAAPVELLRAAFPNTHPVRPAGSVARAMLAWGLLLALVNTASWGGRSTVDQFWGVGLLQRLQALALWMDSTPSLWRQR